jgi:alpha-tubulin suppressor-like RCC1 family protein
MVVAGTNVSCALTTAGAARCWGSSSVIDSWPSLDGEWIQVDTRSDDICLIDTDNNVVCHGTDQRGEIEDTNWLSPPAADLGVGSQFICVVSVTGATSCYGTNSHGQTEAPVGLSFALVSSGIDHACTLTEQGDLECWGRNTNGQSDPPATIP